MQRLAVTELQKQALWLFGVLMGIAIKEAIASFYSDFISRNELRSSLLGLVRLLLFLLVSLRLYLGTVQYFNAAFGAPASACDLRRKRLGGDLIFGLIHFALVCFWGLSITLFERWLVFPALLVTILGYDLGWYFCAARDTRRTIRIRTAVNTVTAGFAVLAFGTTALAFICVANGRHLELTQFQGAICEAVAYVPVVIATAVELGHLVQGRAGVEEWLEEGLPRVEANPG